MSLNFDEINILGNLINDSFGKSSMPGGYGVANSIATKATLHGEVLTVTSLAVINLANLHTQHQEIAKCENELNQYINSYMSDLKNNFKKKEHAGRALKCKQIKDSERNSVEMINHYSENRRAIVRRSIDFEVS